MSEAAQPSCVLVIGKDGRTDAVAAELLESPTAIDLYAFSEMRIPGLVRKCRDVFLGDLTDVGRLGEIVDDIQPDLVVVGPEEPLEAGCVDMLEERGIATFGPSKVLARIETSKAWARRILEKHGIPGNPEYRVIKQAEELEGYFEQLGSFVIKPDGLTAGKGVRVFGEHMTTIPEALSYAKEQIESVGQVQIEEKLEGEEFSLQTITDGETFIHCPVVQDHKRAYDGDKGPNTGGMGSYSCADHSLPFLERSDIDQAREINERVIQALYEETGKPYRGVLYGGFMATADGVRLIEYNARFGDPEAMNVLPILDADFVELCTAVASGRLAEVEYSFQAKATVCKYIVPRDYPHAPPDNRAPFEIPEHLLHQDNLRWYWAASDLDAEDIPCIRTSRSGAFVGLGDTLAEAEQAAAKAAEEVAVVGPIRYRRDIGRAEVIKKRVRHMSQLRNHAVALAARAS